MLSPVYKHCPLCLCGSGPACLWEGKKGAVCRDLSSAQSILSEIFEHRSHLVPLKRKNGEINERTIKRV